MERKIALRPSPIKTQRTVAQLLRDQQDQSLKAQAETASAAKELGAEGHVIREGLEGTLIPLPHVSDFTGSRSLLCYMKGMKLILVLDRILSSHKGLTNARSSLYTSTITLFLILQGTHSPLESS